MVTIQKMGSAMKRALVRLVAVAATVIAAATPAAASTITYYHNDLAGSPVAATNSTAQVIWRESYRPYGERLTKSAAAKPNDVWFTSRRQDSTGLVYMGARYYDPVTGRFMSTDPKGFDEANVQSFDRYAYANNNPYRYVDPDGREPGSLYQRGYVPPAAQIFPEPGLGHPIPEAAALALLVPGFGRAIAGAVLRGAGDESALPLSDSALVCRGGSCTAERFSNGSGVTTDAEGNLNGVSVNSANGKSIGELSASIPNKQVGVTTVGEVRAAGGDVVREPTARNPDHCSMCGISAQKAEELFTPTVRNPNVP